MNNDDVEIIRRETLYEGHLRLQKYHLRHGLFGGGWSPEISRELVVRGDAVCVLPYDPVHDEVVLIEQFRIAAYTGGLPAWQLEIPAGVIDDGMTAEAVGRRELEEEADCTALEMHLICRGLSSSGMLSELASIYCAIVDSSDAGGVHGLVHEHEDIRATVFPFEEAYRRIEEDSFHHIHGIVALQWLAANRDRLRAGRKERSS